MFSLSSAHANSGGLWSDVALKSQGKGSATFNLMPDSYRLLKLNEEDMRDALDAVVNSGSNDANKQAQEQLTLPLPMVSH